MRFQFYAPAQEAEEWMQRCGEMLDLGYLLWQIMEIETTRIDVALAEVTLKVERRLPMPPSTAAGEAAP